jgi:hypothetical protein
MLRLDTLGDIARDFGEANKCSLLISNLLDDPVRAETGAILSDTPTFCLVPANGPGCL